MVKIRLEGLPAQVNAAINELDETFDLLSVSKEYKNRKTKCVRVYLEAEFRESDSYKYTTPLDYDDR